MAKPIDTKELNEMLAKGGKMTLLDVRRKADYEASPKGIPGAAWRDPEKIDAWVKDLPVSRPVVVYCVKGGSVSQSVADRSQQEGLTAAFLEGGLRKWIDDGRPIESS